jgi:hypothetical protein
MPVVCGAVYFPAFDFSFWLKKVAPAWCPGFSYDDLEGVADGGGAASANLQIASGAIGAADEIARLRRQLLAYCERDTLAMAKAHGALRRLAEEVGVHANGIRAQKNIIEN